MRQRLLLAARSILLGWVTLLAAVYLLERPLLTLIGGALGASWFPTIRVMCDCSVLAGTGWVIGRLGRAHPTLAVAAFAVTLSVWNFDELVEIKLPWLLQLTLDALRDSRYWEGWVSAAVIQGILFGCLIAGALLSRPAPPTVLSIVDEPPK